MRVSINKATGKLIEAQSGGETEEGLNTLLQNAVNGGYSADEVEVKIITDDEFRTLLAASEPEATYADKRRAEYPSMYDYIDGIVKGDTAQVQTYVDACLAVKAKYPKE